MPQCVPTARGKISRTIGLTVLNLLGWKICGELPAKSKFVVALAPHTSNWDFVIGVAAMLAMNLKVRFMGKNTIFIWPFKTLLESWGGIPVFRHEKHGVVEQMVEQFAHHQQLILAIAPEGTRSKTAQWKSGFLHIAYQANVPVVPISLDFSLKEFTFHPSVNISENIELELTDFKALFNDVCAKNPQAV